MCPNATLQKLVDGNKRFSEGKSSHPNLGVELRNALVKKQKPFAAILSCSDSRVPVEIIFDVGLGDLFVVRSAGHVLSKEALGSLEYAVSGLGVKLILIMGHDNCGAVTTALNLFNDGSENYSENFKSLLEHIYPALDNLHEGHDNLKEAIICNIAYQLKDLGKRSPYLASMIEQKKLIVAGAKYSLETGEVELFDEAKEELCCS